MNTPDPQQIAAFWAQYRAEVAEIAARAAKGQHLGHIHPAAFRKRAATLFGLRDVPALWAWQAANRARIVRETNRAAKPYGFRLYRGKLRTGYARLERIR